MARTQPLTYEEFKTIYSKVTRLCVDLVIQTPQGIVLSLRQKHGWLNQWHLPGGSVYYQEKLHDTVHRVAQEELGITVTIEKQIGYIEYPSEVIERGFGYSVSIVFLCTSNATTFIADEHAEKIECFHTLPENTIKEQKEFLTQSALA